MTSHPFIPRRDVLRAGIGTGLAWTLFPGARDLLAAPPVARSIRSAAVPYRGIDVSFLPQLDDLGAVFFDGVTPRDPLAALQSRGINLVRLRVWNNPADGYCSPARTLAMAQRAHALGMKLLINFHFSDSWADPGQQNPPAAWLGFSMAQLTSAVADFTGSVLSALAAQGTPATIVQVGNEITAGMLWPLGSNSSNWNNFAALYRAGAMSAAQASPATRLMLHVDRGGDNAGARWFFDIAQANAMPFDIIGLSYYPWWHGTLGVMSSNLADLAIRYAKPIHIVETAYPWSLAWQDATNNFVWQPSQCLPGYSPTPAGQAAYTAAVISTLAALPGNLGQGLCWWAPGYVAVPGLGSPWENLALFDFSRSLLPAAAALASRRSAIPVPL